MSICRYCLEYVDDDAPECPECGTRRKTVALNENGHVKEADE